MTNGGARLQLSEFEINNLLLKRQQQQLTFVLEMELDFSVVTHLYFEWLAAVPNMPRHPDDTDMDDLSSQARDHRVTGREKCNDQIAWGFQKPSMTFSEVTSSKISTDSQAPANLRQNLLHYLLAFLNRQLPTSKPGKMLIGEAAWGSNPKTDTSDTWTVVHDDSLVPGRKGYGQRFQPPQAYDGFKQFFRCLGAELVLKEYAFDEIDSVVFPALKELHKDLEDDYQPGAWFTDDTHLHVNFLVENEVITLELAQTLVVLYGLFENQIEKFVKNSQRESPWRQRLRKGMEGRQLYTAPITLTGGVDIAMRPERRYTQEGFADEVYDTASLEELKSVMSGYSAGEDIPNKPVPQFRAREWTVLNVSLARDNKSTTFEFQHHHGTSDPVEIKFWVQFCGNMLRFAHLLTQSGVKLRDPEADTSDSGNGPTFLEDWVKKDIIDVVGMSNQAKAHFRSQAGKFQGDTHDNKRAVENWMVGKRIQRCKAGGEETGIFMDSEIMASLEYEILKQSHLLLKFDPPPY